MTPRIDGLRAVAGLFDAFLVDQFGVLHDGRRAFPGAVEAMAGLRSAARGVAILSNSGKRAAPNATRLAALGFGPELYDHLVTSGEVARALLIDRLAAGALPSGARVFVLARDADRSPIEGLPLDETDDPQAADLLLILGAEPERLDRAGHARLLAPLARRGAPCLCANPDRRMYAAHGVDFGPGAVAADFEAAGGRVEWIGKPHRAVFDHALRLLGATDPARVAMIGDSAEHDAAGAAAAGCAWVLVEGGAQSGGAPPGGRGFVVDALRW
jgi:HAD superfamily hydrolase (TIGR01459 family)